jgi:hypothetical protein
MAFAYSAVIQNRIALAVWGVQNTGLDADQKILLDGTWTTGTLTTGRAYDAWNEIAQLAQWFEQASSSPDTSLPQPAWTSLFIARTCSLLAESTRPEMVPAFQAEYERSLDHLVDTFSKTLASATDLSGTAQSQSLTLKGIRAFVVNHCIRRKGTNTGLRRRIFPPIEDIDAHLQWTMNHVWNAGSWNFRRRQVVVKINVSEFTDATFTQSTLTLTSTGDFTSYNATEVAGAKALIESGTDAIVGEVVVNSGTDNTLILDSTISDTAADLSTGDIDGKLCWVTMRGLAAGETFDSLSSRHLTYGGDTEADGGGHNRLYWADATILSELRAMGGSGTGRPQAFRTEKRGTSVVWHFAQFPDRNYLLHGAVLVSGPGSFATATGDVDFAAVLAKFPAEFGPVIRDMTLARVLLAHAASDAESFWARAVDQVGGMLPTYADPGTPSRMAVSDDRYADWGDQMTGAFGFIGNSGM